MKTNQIYLSNYGIGKNVFVEHDGHTVNDRACVNDCYMAVYIAHGSGTLKMGDEEFGIFEGDAFLIKPGVIFRIIPDKGLRRIDSYYSLFFIDALTASLDDFREQFPDFHDFLDNDISFIHSVDTDNKEIREILIRMISEQMSDMPCGYNAIRAYLTVLLTKILRNTKTRDFKRIYSMNRTVDEAIRYIHKHMYSKVSLKDLSEHLKLSEAFICRLFKEHVGMTTSQFINLLRVEKIKDVLKNTDKPVEAVPELFNCNIDYLKRVFKRETGMSMQEYRDKYNYRLRSSDEA